MRTNKLQKKFRFPICQLIFIITILFVQQSAGFSQGINNIERYYKYMNKANAELCRFNNEAAFQLFDTGFSLIQYPFAIDLNNAIYAAIHSQHPDEEKILHYMELLQSKDIALSDKYKDLPDHMKYVNMLDKESRVPSTVDTYYSKRIFLAIDADQLLRTYSLEEFGAPYAPSLLPAINKVDSANYMLIDSIFKYALKRNLPLQQLLGNDDEKDLEEIYIHNVAWGRYDKALTDSLIFAGLIDARQYATLYDRSCNIFFTFDNAETVKWDKKFKCDEVYGIYGTKILRQYTDGTGFILMLNPEELEIVNQNRKTLFLGDVYEDAKMKIFSHWYQDAGVESSMKSIFEFKFAFISDFENKVLDWRPGYYKYQKSGQFEFDQKPILK